MKKKKHFILSEEEKKELDRRIENITNHPETLITWEDVKEKMTWKKDKKKIKKIGETKSN